MVSSGKVFLMFLGVMGVAILVGSCDGEARHLKREVVMVQREAARQVDSLHRLEVTFYARRDSVMALIRSAPVAGKERLVQERARLVQELDSLRVVGDSLFYLKDSVEREARRLCRGVYEKWSGRQ